MKNKLIQVFGTKVGWLFICIFLVIICGTFSPNYGALGNYGGIWCDYVMWAAISYILVITIIMILFAWIINPVKLLINNKKKESDKKT